MLTSDRLITRQINEAAQDLRDRIDVAAVLETMVDDLEIWEWATEAKRLEAELKESQDALAEVRASEAALRESMHQSRLKLEVDQAAARELKSRLGLELWALAKEFRAREVEREEAVRTAARLSQLPVLEKEVSELRRELEDSKMEVLASEARAASLAQAVEESKSKATAAARSQSRSPRVPTKSIPKSPPPPLTPPPPQCLLLTLPDATLLKLFSYLNAECVLSAASCCKGTLRKVGDLFSPPTPQPEAPVEQGSTSAQNGTSEQAVIPATPSVAKQDASTTVVVSQGGGVAAMARQRIGSLPGGVVSLFMSAVAGQKGETPGGTPTSASAATHVVASGEPSAPALKDVPQKGPPSGVNMDVAMPVEAMHSLSRKLSLVEMKSIIGITEKLKKASLELAQLQAERDAAVGNQKASDEKFQEISAQLENAEAELAGARAERLRAAQQASSDQEVIMFLDSKVQEVEKVATEAMDKAVQAQTLLEEERAAHQRREKAQGELLELERRQAEEEMASLRQAKRLLVAEVRKLRNAHRGSADLSSALGLGTGGGQDDTGSNSSRDLSSYL